MKSWMSMHYNGGVVGFNAAVGGLAAPETDVMIF
jgi:hypothetical protein